MRAGRALWFRQRLSYAVYLVCSGEFVKRLGSLRLAGLATSVACVLCIAQFVLLRPVAALVAPEVIWLSVLNATLCTFAPVLMVMMAIERIGAALAAQTGMIGPLSTILMGVLILGEPFTAWIAAGTALVLPASACSRDGPQLKEQTWTWESRARWALVCAASKGLGRGCALALVREGVNVVITARGADALEAAAKNCGRAAPAASRFVPWPATSRPPKAAPRRSPPARRFDILVNNAGGPPPGDFRDWDRDAWIKASTPTC